MLNVLYGVILAYLGVGFLFALAFVTIGAGRVDPAARNGPIGFRLLIFPGSVALWPLLALRWMRAPAAQESAS